jgi:hypothetical protein
VIAIDGHPIHAAEIDDDAAAQGAAGPVVSAAPNRQQQTAIACHSDRQLDIVGRPAVGARHGATGFAQIAVAAG